MSKMKADYETFSCEEELKKWLNSQDLNRLTILSIQYMAHKAIRPWIIFYIYRDEVIE